MYLLLAGYTKDSTLVVVYIALAGFASGLTYSGFHVNMLDIAPRNASIIMGFCNTVGGTTGFITPMMVGFLTRGKVCSFNYNYYYHHHAVIIVSSLPSEAR